MIVNPRTVARGSAWRPVAVSASVALALVGAISAPRLGLPVLVTAVLAGLTAVLTVFALPSVPTRRATVLLLGIAGFGALRHAAVPSTDSTLLVAWTLATLATLLLVDRAQAEMAPPLPGSTPLGPRGVEVLRSGVAIGSIVAVAAVALVPTITDELGRHLWPGAVPGLGDRLDAPSSLRSSSRLDMSDRPRLSDDVVFTVDAPRPDFWRGETFDVWDGQGWTRSDSEVFALRRSGDTVRLLRDPFDIGAERGEELRQTFFMESGFSELVFGAPSAVQVETDKVIVGWRDGTAGVVGGFGKGAVYSVTSRRLPVTDDALRAAETSAMPAAVLDRYAAAPVATSRVVELARAITAGQPTTYDKIRAIEEWLGTNTEYSLDAPLSPDGVDVVDHFVFESKLGWCEQVASALVVMARASGIPARLVTGFVPDKRDSLSGRFVVRERNAHAWAEVYFPGVGWQGFDPTASVPLSGERAGAGSWIEIARRNVVAFVAVIGVLLALVAVGPDFVVAARRRLRRRSWAETTQARVERLGRRIGRPRHGHETPREYARALAVDLCDPRLDTVGDAIDREFFAPDGAGDARRSDAERVLAQVRAHER